MEEVEIICKVYPTEDLRKILRVLQSFFPTAKFLIMEKEDKDRYIKYYFIVGRSSNPLVLDSIRREMGRRNSLDILEKVLKENEREYGFDIVIDKQALMVGKVVVSDKECCPVLGNIIVRIKTKNKNAFLNWMCL